MQQQQQQESMTESWPEGLPRAAQFLDSSGLGAAGSVDRAAGAVDGAVGAVDGAVGEGGISQPLLKWKGPAGARLSPRAQVAIADFSARLRSLPWISRSIVSPLEALLLKGSPLGPGSPAESALATASMGLAGALGGDLIELRDRDGDVDEDWDGDGSLNRQPPDHDGRRLLGLATSCAGAALSLQSGGGVGAAGAGGVVLSLSSSAATCLSASVSSEAEMMAMLLGAAANVSQAAEAMQVCVEHVNS